MKQSLRRVETELRTLVANKEIQDYRFAAKTKHYKVKFLHAGTWYTIPISHNSGNNIFTRQNIRRIIRG